LVSSALIPKAAAEPAATFRLSWVRGPGAEECPSAQQLAAAVSARLGRDPFSDTASRDIEASVTRVNDDWQAHLSVLGPEGASLGSRELEAHGPDCSSLADAVTLALVLTIDPGAKLDGTANVAAETSKPSPQSVVTPVPPSRSPEHALPFRVEPRRERPAPAQRTNRRGMTIASRGLVTSGLLPATSFGAELGGELPLVSALRLSLSMSYFPEVQSADGRFGFGVSAGGFGLCYAVLERSRAAAALCGEVQAGAIHVVVFDLEPVKPGERLWVSTRFGPRLAVSVAGPLELELGAYAVFPLIRHQFAIEGVSEPFFQSSAVSLLASAGLAVSIP
jgi:hypothetical protein